MSTITKEWLQQKISDMENARDEIPFGLDEDDSNTLAALRIALTSLEAEPVAYTDAEELRFPHATSDMWPAPLGHGMNLPLYTAAPAPVSVPDVLRRLCCIVADPRALPRRKEWISGQQYSYVLLENVEAMVDDACRAAMLQGADGKSPVIPDGWVLVPVEPTYQMCEAMGLPWESPRFPDRYKAMIAAAPQQEVK